MPYLALEKLHQLYDGYRKPMRVAGRDVLLVQQNGKVHLIHNRCPHLGAPLTHATLADNNLRCQQHGIEFDLRTGWAVNSSACPQRLEFLPLVYEGNTIGVDVV